MSGLAKVYGQAVEPQNDLYAGFAPRKKKSKRIIRYKGRSLIFWGIILYVVLVFGYWHYKINVVNAEILSLEAQKSALLAEQALLNDKKELVLSKEYIEKTARENLGLVKPGEKVLLFAKPGEVMPLEVDEHEEIYD